MDDLEARIVEHVKSMRQVRGAVLAKRLGVDSKAVRYAVERLIDREVLRPVQEWWMFDRWLEVAD